MMGSMSGCLHSVYTVGKSSSDLTHSGFCSAFFDESSALPKYIFPVTFRSSGPTVVENFAEVAPSGRSELMKLFWLPSSDGASVASPSAVGSGAAISGSFRCSSRTNAPAIFRRSDERMGATGLSWKNCQFPSVCCKLYRIYRRFFLEHFESVVSTLLKGYGGPAFVFKGL